MHLLLFTFGPVQAFITQARKTADLFAGSAILTRLASAAVEAIAPPHLLLFPSREYTESLTNRIVIQVKGDAETARRVGQLLEAAVRSKWDHIALTTLGRGYMVNPAVTAQLNQHLEISWGAVPLGTDYRNAYAHMNTCLAADKNQRQWTTDLHEPWGRKCALDGTRNALFYRGAEKRPRFLVEQAIVISDDSLQPNEGLSAVSYLKRKYGQERRYPSTATIALLHILDRANLTIPFFSEDQLYFEENLTESYFKKIALDPIRLNTSQKEQKIWKKKVEEMGLLITPYYALLHFDGDNMGKWFSGELLPDRRRLADFQAMFTQLLGDFARQATAFLDEPHTGRGRTVYGGGDDFVGFVNLSALFDVLFQIRALFNRIVNEPLREAFQLTTPVNFSAGVAVAHYKQPLGMVLDQARNMEKQAKTRPGKNAWGLSINVRSGATEELVLPWLHDGIYPPMHMEELLKAIEKKHLGTAFINNHELSHRHYGEWLPLPVFAQQRLEYLFNRSVSPNASDQQPDLLQHLHRALAPLSDPGQRQTLLNCLEFFSRHVRMQTVQSA